MTENVKRATNKLAETLGGCIQEEGRVFIEAKGDSVHAEMDFGIAPPDTAVKLISKAVSMWGQIVMAECAGTSITVELIKEKGEELQSHIFYGDPLDELKDLGVHLNKEDEDKE